MAFEEQATDSKQPMATTMDFCKGCIRKADVSYNYGGLSCRGCAAFFRRFVRNDIVLKCKQIIELCTRPSEGDFTCKKCRLDRCVNLGMMPKCMPPLTFPSQSSFQLSETKKANVTHASVSNIGSNGSTVKAAYQCRAPVNPDLNKHTGTSGSKNFFSLQMQPIMYHHELKLYHHMLDITPIIGGLNRTFKEAIFKNSFQLYTVFAHHLINSRQKHRRPNTSYVIEHRCFDIILIIIHSNDFDKHNLSWQEPFSRLKEVWKEIDAYFKFKGQDESSWGELIMLLSELQSRRNQYVEVVNMVTFIRGREGIMKQVETKDSFDKCNTDFLREN
ncbi:hypothetical protein L596_022807 [Steinernema carpocapsae]|uniref:Nuclear receptor domain-containing protein n=1 Tax=Steinernema carpocapsae TaxID=34508 RepID=A0A4U5MPF2_STECR|nr:hypothetical protein L596_022807 [Steinernema carpocapsae]